LKNLKFFATKTSDVPSHLLNPLVRKISTSHQAVIIVVKRLIQEREKRVRRGWELNVDKGVGRKFSRGGQRKNRSKISKKYRKI